MGDFLPQSVVEDALVFAEEDQGVMVASIGCQTVREWQAAMIRGRLEQVAGACAGRVALSLAGVTGVGSAFVRDLIRLTDHCSTLGGRLVLYSLSSEVQALFKTAGFDQKLHMAQTREEAISAVTSGARRRGFFGRLMGRHAA
ncbi:MAG: STAS domain-containing protein [Phycisphaeraceae bacterium]|nr:STAS domain-containing protein [Phycisphaeraceae bacterium]